ncbi:MAG: pitrilysin family protein [Candidatus Paceibacterota bacterium]|jgi:predicted Zn-dependent peptidase
MKINKTILPNGMRVVTVPMPDNPSVTVLVMVEAGSKYETKEISGLSHFLEHMTFKGTLKRPKAIDISRELDSIGAHYNAFTSQEYTGYYAKADKRYANKMLDVISDMYQNPLFDENEIKKEKGVIIEEIRMYQDLPQRHVQDVFMELLYGDQPAGWNIAGTEANIHAFNREHFMKYRKNNYVSSATTIIVAGSFAEKEMLKNIKTAFKTIPDSKKTKKLAVKESQSLPQIKVDFKETDQTHLVIGARTFHIKDKRIPTMLVLSSILGGGMSSRLFSKMRDELGICYYIRTLHDSFTDHGVLTVSAGVDNSRVKEGICGILGECDRLKKELVSDADLQKVKDYIAGTTMLELETSDARAEFCGYQEILKKSIDLPKEIIEKVNKITASDVQKLAREIFVNKGLNMAIVGRFKDDSQFKGYFKFL